MHLIYEDQKGHLWTEIREIDRAEMRNARRLRGGLAVDDRTKKELQEIVDAVIRARMAQLRELQVQDFADCISIFLANFAEIMEARTDSRFKELLAQSGAEAKETVLRKGPGFY